MTLPITPAGRLQVMNELLRPEILAEDGETVVGYGEPLITEEEAVKLLELPTFPKDIEDA